MKNIVLRFLSKAYHSTIRSLFRRFVQCDPTPSRNLSTNSVFISILSPFETYVVSLQSLLIWEKPYLSAVSFVLLNCLFWLVVSWNRRFISIIAIIILVLYVYRTWVNQIWPEIRVQPSAMDESEDWIRVHPQVLSVPELGHYVNEYAQKALVWWTDLMKLRQANHALFCLLGCTVFSLLAFIGHMIPGVLIIYFFVLVLSLGPGIMLHLIPATIYDQLAGLFSDEENLTGSFGKPVEKDELDEFLPESSSSEALKQLSMPQDPLVLSSLAVDEEDQDEHHLSTIRELGMDSFVCEGEESLFTGLGSFPSVEEENESDLEDDISPNVDLPSQPDASGIHFVSTHFNNSSDSDNDAVFTEGLSFKDTTLREVKDSPTDKIDTSSEQADDGDVSKAKVPCDLDEELMDFEILEESDIS